MNHLMRIYIFVEGQTEETFVQEVLYLPFLAREIHLIPILLSTSRKGKGGATSYYQIKRQVDRKCKEDPQAFVTTMLDLYRLPTDFPGYSKLQNISDPYDKVACLEKTWKTQPECNDNFIPYISLHEFEALLFTELEKFKVFFPKEAVDHLVKPPLT